MTNKEKYLEILATIAIECDAVAVVDGEPAYCSETPCADCDFCKDKESESCDQHERQVFDWAYAEYVED